MTRHDYNKLILDKISEYLDTYPDIRFGQALVNLKILEYSDIEDNKGFLLVKDPFYEEPSKTYFKITEN